MNQQNKTIDPVQLKKNRQKIVLIFSIGIVPMIIAYLLFYLMPGFAPQSTTNEGHLIMPPLQIADYEPLNQDIIPLGRWLMIIPVGANCDAACEDILYLTRQTNIALGKEQPRVKRLALVGASAETGVLDGVLEEHPNLDIRHYADRDLLNEFRAKAGADEELVVFLMDPNGNIMMAYTHEELGKPMLKDLRHLLKLSNIG
ncbi:MAG: hypothetical protein KDI36_15305 [Pseudomonadales bacterium]|nr:hypothetical protein [Pseudomonadales bacterium]